jgi:hypothetical protein
VTLNVIELKARARDYHLSIDDGRRVVELAMNLARYTAMDVESAAAAIDLAIQTDLLRHHKLELMRAVLDSRPDQQAIKFLNTYDLLLNLTV